MLASAVGLALASAASAGPIGGEPPDFDADAGFPTFTAQVGSNTVGGTIGPSPDDIQDQFSVVIPPNVEVTSVSYAGPSDEPNSIVGCGLTGGQQLNVTFDPAQSGCTLTWAINQNFAVSSAAWTVTIGTQAGSGPADTQAPVLHLPGDMTVEADSAAGATVNYAATATDDIDLSPTVVCNPAAGVFADGTTTVSCSATDDFNNTANGSFTVTVHDTTPPVLDVPDDVTVEATGPTTEISYPTATATDVGDDDGVVNVICDPTSPFDAGVGAHQVSCTATDDSNNPSSDSFTVSVQDTTAPVLEVPGDMFVPATGPDGAEVAFAASATDLVDGAIDASCSPASGSTFALGDTSVECTTTDAADNTSTGSFTVTVQDETFPSLELPGDITVEATGPEGADATYDVTATDLTDTDVEVVCTPASATTFPLGVTTVECAATDNDGNVTAGGFTVTVIDTSAPVLSLPGDIVAPSGGPDGAIVEFEVTATDVVAGAVPVDCVPPSGSRFAVGTTTVTCTARDRAPASLLGSFGQARRPVQVDTGNVATGAFTVTVEPAQTSPSTSTTSPSAPGAPTTAPPAATLPSTGGQPLALVVAALAAVTVGGILVGLAGFARRRNASARP